MSLSVSGCCSAQRFECLILWRKGQRWARCSVPQLQCWRDFFTGSYRHQTRFFSMMIRITKATKRKKHANSWYNYKVGRIRGDWYVPNGMSPGAPINGQPNPCTWDFFNNIINHPPKRAVTRYGSLRPLTLLP